MTTPLVPGRPRRDRVRRAAMWTALTVGIPLLGAACKSSPYDSRSGGVPEGDVPLTASTVFAPVTGNGEGELYRLEFAGGQPGAVLRRAWIRLQQGQLDDAERLVDSVLYRYPGPSPSTEAIGCAVRAEIADARGQTARAERDRARARELAVDPVLRARLDSTVPADPTDLATAVPASAPRASFYPRSLWEPKRPVGNRLDPMGRIYRITVHHSAVVLRRTDVGSARSAIRHIQKEHMDGRGYGDIGYHYLIDPSGRIWAGRELKFQGAHARGRHNEGNIGICVLGSFVRGRDGQAPTVAQVHSLTALVELLRKQFVIPPTQLHTHREFVATACPGDRLQAVVDRLRGNLTAAAKE